MNGTIPKDAFTIVEGKDGKSRWVRIGSAFTNKDGSMNIFLDALPLDGKVQIRERKKNNTEETNN